MKSFSDINGFTIIEIIVVIAVITLLMGLSYTGYASFSHRQKLISAGQTLKNTLRDIQSRNFNNEVDCSVCNCTDPTANILEGWTVDLATRTFFGRCQGIPFIETGLNLQADIVIDNNAVNDQINYLSEPFRINTSEDIVICLSLTGLSNMYYQIEVSRSGDISDSEGLISTCTSA